MPRCARVAKVVAHEDLNVQICNNLKIIAQRGVVNISAERLYKTFKSETEKVERDYPSCRVFVVIKPPSDSARGVIC